MLLLGKGEGRGLGGERDELVMFAECLDLFLLCSGEVVEGDPATRR